MMSKVMSNQNLVREVMENMNQSSNNKQQELKEYAKSPRIGVTTDIERLGAPHPTPGTQNRMGGQMLSNISNDKNMLSTTIDGSNLQQNQQQEENEEANFINSTYHSPPTRHISLGARSSAVQQQNDVHSGQNKGGLITAGQISNMFTVASSDNILSKINRSTSNQRYVTSQSQLHQSGGNASVPHSSLSQSTTLTVVNPTQQQQQQQQLQENKNMAHYSPLAQSSLSQSTSSQLVVGIQQQSSSSSSSSSNASSTSNTSGNTSNNPTSGSSQPLSPIITSQRSSQANQTKNKSPLAVMSQPKKQIESKKQTGLGLNSVGSGNSGTGSSNANTGTGSGSSNSSSGTDTKNQAGNKLK
ncbi:MAG: hypothetical protein EZS28_006744 [Streblomastix strix]|uniref:Uncharacterized protein n=1 Tax=Streblomastix strix TaxID=222440 RepID=A0A5J4WT71_9EUKA|nr:MAG: hypothetical protein EZS28_006744 [Streblomastix strix]